MLAWDDFRLVKAIAERRSLAGAAEILGVNASTVFRRLGALEDRLGARLFERGRAGYGLTPAATKWPRSPTAWATTSSPSSAASWAQDLAPTGELRITTNDSMLIHGLTDVFAGFRRAYPDITLDVVVGNAVLNLSKRDADIALAGHRLTARDAGGPAAREHLLGRSMACRRSARSTTSRRSTTCPGSAPATCSANCSAGSATWSANTRWSTG